MWIKKTEEEILAVRQHQQSSPRIPLLLATCTTALSVPMSNAPSIPFAIGVFLFTFVIAYASQEMSGGRFWLTFPGNFATQSRDDPVICVACYEVQNEAPHCSKCGGALEALALWSWQNDAKAADASPTEKT